MAKVQGMKEKLHMPIYDAFFVPEPKNGSGPTFQSKMADPRLIRFFVDVQNKTRLETNLQAAGVLPSLNTFEARALRVVAATPKVELERTAILEAGNKYCGELKEAAEKEDEAKKAAEKKAQDALYSTIRKQCQEACVAAGSVLADLIYNSVTTLLVGEKTMIEMPTYWFPSGAGVFPGGNGSGFNHGEPDPMATFRFAEPVMIEPQQNFRVEMLFPRGLPPALKAVQGPLRVWVVLDGYLTRDVQ
jgi:hypothetical protein